MSDHEQRVRDEQRELGSKMRKLTDFFGTDTFKKLPSEDRALLQIQSYAMSTYWRVLVARIERFT